MTRASRCALRYRNTAGCFAPWSVCGVCLVWEQKLCRSPGISRKTWSEQQRIGFRAPEYLRTVIRIITETGLSGIAEVPLTQVAIEAFRGQTKISDPGFWLFPSDRKSEESLKAVWYLTLRQAKVRQGTGTVSKILEVV
jgi:hypothetical protein